MDILSDMIQRINEFISFKNVVSALLALVICMVFIKVVVAFTGRLLKKSKLEPTVHSFIKSTIKIVLYVIMIIIVAGTLGIETSSIIALFSVVGLAVSLAIQDSLANAASGVSILLTKPFLKGDFVEIGGVSGTVDRVGVMNTRLRTPDNKIIFVPNNTVCTENIINYSHETTRRVEINVSASYESSIESAKTALLEAAQISADKILKSPEIFVGVNNYGASAIEYVVRFWVDADDYWTVYYKVMEDIYTCFEKHGVEMTYNHIIIHNDK